MTQQENKGNSNMQKKKRNGVRLIMVIGGVGDVCDIGVLSLLPSKNNIGIWLLWSEKWGES